MIKAMTLNLWAYYEWEKRKDSIIFLVTAHQPDFIGLQEVQTNLAFSAYPSSDFIADACRYKYRVFAPTYPRNNQIDQTGERTQRTSYGLAFLSKHRIISSESYFLKLYPDHDEESSVLFCKIEVEGKIIDICTVHFANSDKHSELHLRELMELCAKRNIQPIILGDFNNFNLATYKNTILKDYTLSSEIIDYTSMPKNNGTLDYIIAPSSQYTLTDVLCPNDYVSDHRALFATVEQN